MGSAFDQGGYAEAVRQQDIAARQYAAQQQARQAGIDRDKAQLLARLTGTALDEPDPAPAAPRLQMPAGAGDLGRYQLTAGALPAAQTVDFTPALTAFNQSDNVFSGMGGLMTGLGQVLNRSLANKQARSQYQDRLELAKHNATLGNQSFNNAAELQRLRNDTAMTGSNMRRNEAMNRLTGAQTLDSGVEAVWKYGNVMSGVKHGY